MTNPRIVIGLLSHLLLTVTISQISVVSGGDLETLKRRRDPLNGLKYYNGGFDVRNRHYWAATVFTGFYGYIIAVMWIIAGVCFGVYLVFSDNKRKWVSSLRRRFLDSNYVHLFLLLVLFMFLAMATTGIVIAANQSSKNRTEEMKEDINKAGDIVESNIRTVLVSLTKIQYLLLPYDQNTTHLLNVTSHRLGKGSRKISNFVRHTHRSIDLAIKISYATHLAIASTNLFVLLLAFAPILLHWHPGFIMVILFCWILTTFCWVVTGFDFFIHNFVEDACSAFNGYLQNPQNSSISNLFPCMDPLHSDKTLTQIRIMIQTFIIGLNTKVANSLHSSAPTDQRNRLSSSAPETGIICDPFYGQHINSYTPQSCSNGAIPIGEFPNILSSYTCPNQDPPETCRVAGKFISESAFLKVSAYSNSAQGMLDILPSLQNLTQCLVVKDTISNIVSKRCKPFRVSIYRLWASMLALSLVMKFLVLLVLAKAVQEKGKRFVWFSIKPVSDEEETRQVNI